ncbi:MAG: NUDIX hydrolase [Acidimicrobiales bacterium]
MAAGVASQRVGRASVDARVEPLRAVIEHHRAGDERERASCAAVLDALDNLERPFDRHAQLHHVTASAIVTGHRGTVLHLHKRLGRWLQPGGHVDGSEETCDAARRESEEETGLDLSHPLGGPRLVHVDAHDAADSHVHLDLRYLLVAPDEDPSPGPGESPEVRWFAWDEALGIADEALLGALRAARSLTVDAKQR